MTQREVADVREILERTRESMESVLDALLAPYEGLGAADPDAAIGPPVDVPPYVRPSSIRRIADDIVHNGRSDWAVYQVDERATQLEDLVRDFRRGAYRETSAGDWVRKMRVFRDAVLADMNTALQAPRGWDRIDLKARGAKRGPPVEDAWLRPQDVAPELRLNERTVRRQIQAGKLGPWTKKGGRWVISRDAFLRFWADQIVASDSDVPQPPRPPLSAAELERRLIHIRLCT